MDLYMGITCTITFVMVLLYMRKSMSSEYKGIFYYLKWLTSLIYLKLFWKRDKQKKVCRELTISGLGLLPMLTEEKNDMPQQYLNTLESSKTFDAVSFNGTDNEGNYVLIELIKYADGSAETRVLIKLINIGTLEIPDNSIRFYCDTKDNSFSAAGLKCQVLEANRRWRISFNGFLRKTANYDLIGKEEKLNITNTNIIHARFTFTWSAISIPFNNNTELSQNNLAHNAAKIKWNKSIFTNLNWLLNQQDVKDYCTKQWGQIRGILNIDEEELILNLRGLRERSFGQINLNTRPNEYGKVEVYFQNGSALHFDASRSQDLLLLTKGSFYTSDDNIHQITWSDLNLHSDGDLSVKSLANISFLADGIKCVVKADLMNSSQYVLKAERLCYLTVFNCNFTFDNVSGFGFIKLRNKSDNFNISNKINKTLLLPSLKSQKIGKILVINIQSDLATSHKYAGGKGSSLALLNRLNDKFTIPTAICVTSAAYDMQLENCDHLKDLIHQLEAVAWKSEKGNLEDACQKLVITWRQTVLNTNIKQHLQKEMENTFGIHYQTVRLAIRSSAIGEDSEELSSAGQNETYLGISGFDNICEAVINCWASQFTYTAIEYKRQNGQLLNPGMAVVIQEMVPAEVAGVLFTHDPNNGNPGTVIITANYGLGESVVSASAEPDTIFLNRSYDNKLSVGKKILGSKNIQIIQNPNKNGTEDIAVPSEESTKFCLTNEQSLELGRMGILIEQSFGSPRDIEWCIVRDHIHLLQARPITTFDQATDFEIMHEFDSPIKTDKDHCTKANIGEVFPQAITPLTLNTVLKSLDLAMQRSIHSQSFKKITFNPNAAFLQITAYNHCMLNCIDMLCRDSKGIRSPVFRNIEISIYGHSLKDDLMYKINGERYRRLRKSWLELNYLMIKGLLLNKSILDKSIRKYENYRFPLEEGNSLSLYSSIIALIPALIEVILYHCMVTKTATVWNLIAIMTLTEGSEEWTESVYTDVATLLANCSDVKSSEVPIAMKELAQHIAADENKDNFHKMDVKLALEWLRDNKGKVGTLFNDFLLNHGHRCINEMDLSSQTWRQNPTGLVQILQSLYYNLNDSNSRKQNNSIKETIDKLITPKKKLTKTLLAWILPYYRSSVGYREHSKSIVVHVIDQLRMAYLRLSDQMIKEGFLPDPQLIFFFTHLEIGQLLKTRSPKLLKQAIRRKKLQIYLDQLQFPEIIVGVPKPIQVEQTETQKENSVLQISGTPVCNGKAKGTARVVLNLEEAKNIQPNDILITYSTDIGWSPYFPLLSGIVTEIGGIVSHGAVVAREYGLPCIVGAHNATRLFKSGEEVILNGSKGILQKTTEEI